MRLHWSGSPLMPWNTSAWLPKCDWGLRAMRTVLALNPEALNAGGKEATITTTQLLGLLTISYLDQFFAGDAVGKYLMFDRIYRSRGFQTLGQELQVKPYQPTRQAFYIQEFDDRFFGCTGDPAIIEINTGYLLQPAVIASFANKREINLVRLWHVHTANLLEAKDKDVVNPPSTPPAATTPPPR